MRQDLCHGRDGFPRAEGAEEMLRDYDTIQQTLPSMRRVCRPPPMEVVHLLNLDEPPWLHQLNLDDPDEPC